MSKVLFVKANDRPVEQSTSVQMYETFLKSYQESNPGDVVTELDLYNVELPYYGNAAITALYKASQGYELTAEEQQLAGLVNSYLDQFLAADKVVFAFPLWNFTVPAPLITYISYLSQAGKTFKYTAEGPIGLAADKQVVLLSARGGDYSNEQMAAMEMAVKYVQTSLGFWGIHNPEVVVIEGHNQYQDRAKDIVAAGLTQTAELAGRF
ncbi:FMN-dependent NADH-azoreductase 1 [compost metagenome]